MFLVPPPGLTKPKGDLVEFVATASSQNTTGTTLVATLPSGIQAGDLILLFIAANGGLTTDIDSVPGFSKLIEGGSISRTSQVSAMDIWSRTASGGDSNPTITFAITSAHQCISMLYRNVGALVAKNNTGTGISNHTSPTWADNEGVFVGGWYVNRDSTFDVNVTGHPSTMAIRNQIDGSLVGRDDMNLGVYDLKMANRGNINRARNYDQADVALIFCGLEMRTA